MPATLLMEAKYEGQQLAILTPCCNQPTASMSRRARLSWLLLNAVYLLDNLISQLYYAFTSPSSFLLKQIASQTRLTTSALVPRNNLIASSTSTN